MQGSSVLWFLRTQFSQADMETRFSTITLCAKWPSFPCTHWIGDSDYRCTRGLLWNVFCMVVVRAINLKCWPNSLYILSYLNDTKSKVYLKVFMLSSPETRKFHTQQQCTSSGAVTATELHSEIWSFSEPQNKGKNHQDVENESPCSWTPSVPQTIPPIKPLWSTSARFHSIINCNCSNEHLAILSVCLLYQPVDTGDLKRLFVLIKMLQIPQGYRRKLRKI